jgi:hypothetical protein
MKKRFLFFVVLCVISSLGHGEKNPDWFPFSEVKQQEGLVKLQLPNEGVHWLMALNAAKPEDFRLSNYGEIVKLKVGDRLEMHEKHMKIVFEPLFKNKNLYLKKSTTLDSRSVEGKVKTQSILIPVPANMPQAERASPIELTIKPDRQVYEAGEEIKLTAAFTNNSDKEQIIFWNDDNPALASGGGGTTLNKFIVSPADAVYIKPNEVAEKIISAGKAGAHDLAFTLVYDDSSVILDFETTTNQRIFQGSLISNAASIKVAQRNRPISQAKALKIAERVCREAKWKWKDVSIVDANGAWQVTTNSHADGSNAFIRIDKRTGKVLKKSFGPL